MASGNLLVRCAKGGARKIEDGTARASKKGEIIGRHNKLNRIYEGGALWI